MTDHSLLTADQLAVLNDDWKPEYLQLQGERHLPRIQHGSLVRPITAGKRRTKQTLLAMVRLRTVLQVPRTALQNAASGSTPRALQRQLHHSLAAAGADPCRWQGDALDQHPGHARRIRKDACSLKATHLSGSSM